MDNVWWRTVKLRLLNKKHQLIQTIKFHVDMKVVGVVDNPSKRLADRSY